MLLCSIIMLYHSVMLNCITLNYAMLCYIMLLCYINEFKLCYVMLYYYVMLYHSVMLNYITLNYTMLCYITLLCYTWRATEITLVPRPCVKRPAVHHYIYIYMLVHMLVHIC